MIEKNKNISHCSNLARQFNQAMGEGSRRTVVECRNKIKRLKAKYHEERRRRNRSGASADSKFPFFDEMDGVLGARPMSQGQSSFSTMRNAGAQAEYQNGKSNKMQFIL